MASIWVLTYEVNEYDQHDAYFLAAFSRKPSISDLKLLNLNVTDTYLNWILSGGGRKDTEYKWYFLFEYQLT